MGLVRNALVTATIATLGTTIAAMAMSQKENGDPASAINATSHILWGDEAFHEDGLSPEFTLVGAALNAGAMLGWAALQELALGRWSRRGSIVRPVASGALTSAVAYATDYHVVPARLTPGLERRLSPAALALMYGVLAATLAVGVRKGR